MKAISLWQPWASAIAAGSKTIETRHWSTHYRGPLAIHAAKRQIKSELEYLWAQPYWRGATSAVIRCNDRRGWVELPFGAIVAIVDLAACLPTEGFGSEIDVVRKASNLMDGAAKAFAWTERQMGDFSAGRFGWVFQNIRRLRHPVPFKGRQGFFSVPDELIKETTQ